MKKLIVGISLLAITLTGAAYAQSQSDATLEKPATTVVLNDVIPVHPILMAAEPSATSTDQQKPDAAEKPKRPLVNFGLEVGVYSPVSSEVRDTFGNNWLRLGIRPIPRDRPEKYRVTFDTSYYAMSRFNLAPNDTVVLDKVELIPITVGLLRGFRQGKDVRSYIAFNVGPYYGNVKAPSIGVDEQAWKLNANLSAGLVLSNRMALEGRYEFMEKLGGLDFSAFTLSLSYKIFSARL